MYIATMYVKSELGLNDCVNDMILHCLFISLLLMSHRKRKDHPPIATVGMLTYGGMDLFHMLAGVWDSNGYYSH